MNYKNGRIITKKQDKGMRGIGLRSVKATVEKHTETVDIEHNDTDFFVKINDVPLNSSKALLFCT